MPEFDRSDRFFHRRRWLIVLIILIAAVILWRIFFFGSTAMDSSKWQAVFLNNGQVYFGHLDEAQKDYIHITNVFYLRAAQTLQPLSSSTPAPSFELVKLGGELHGPEDAIYLEKSSVLFWENMKPDSQVVQAIMNFQKVQK